MDSSRHASAYKCVETHLYTLPNRHCGLWNVDPRRPAQFDCFIIALGTRRITQMAWLPHAGEFTATVLVKGQEVYTIESFTGSMLCSEGGEMGYEVLDSGMKEGTLSPS